MTPFEYLLAFAAVILGLAVTELAIKTHRLIGSGAHVRWDLLSPLAAVVVLLKIITQWWSWFPAQALVGGLRFEMFIAVIISGVLLFLLAATALPDADHSREVDLARHYAQVSRRFWLLFAAHGILAAAVSTWAQVVIAGARFSGFSLVYLVFPAAVALAFIRLRWIHGMALLTMAGLYLAQNFGRHLG